MPTRKLPPELQLTLSKDSKSAIAFADTHSKNTIVSAKNIEAVRGGTKAAHPPVGMGVVSRRRNMRCTKCRRCATASAGTHIIIETTGRRQDSYAHWFWKRCESRVDAFQAHCFWRGRRTPTVSGPIQR
jgi:hypothetical protein